ncbi:MAG: hypothetical protein WCC64_18910 [Aliidongia sp.]
MKGIYILAFVSALVRQANAQVPDQNCQVPPPGTAAYAQWAQHGGFGGKPAPPGYYYPQGSCTAVPIDMCLRPRLEGVVSWINSGAHLNKHVVSIRNLMTPEQGQNIGDPSSLVCHGTLIFDDSSTQDGQFQIRDPGNSAPLQVVWHADCAGKPYYQFPNGCPGNKPPPVINDPPNVVNLGPNPMDEIRTSAQKEPNKTVHCNVNMSSFWTTNAVCGAIIEESSVLSGKRASTSQVTLVDECAKDISRKLPGKDEPTYLNACESLVKALH